MQRGEYHARVIEYKCARRREGTVKASLHESMVAKKIVDGFWKSKCGEVAKQSLLPLIYDP